MRGKRGDAGQLEAGTRVPRYKLALLFRYELCIPSPRYVAAGALQRGGAGAKIGEGTR